MLTTKRLRHFPRKSRNRYRPSLTRPSRPEFCTNSFTHSAPHASPCLVCLVPHLTVERRKGKLQFKTIALGYISTPAEERSTRTPRRCCRRFRHGLRLESYGSSPPPSAGSTGWEARTYRDTHYIHTSYHPSHITRARVQLTALTSRPNCAALGGLSKKVANAFTTSACKARCPRLDLRKATTAAFSAPDSATISLAALRRRLEERAAPLC